MSLNNDHVSHFFLNKNDYDYKLTISIDGKEEDSRKEILESLYIELPTIYEPYPLATDNNLNNITKIIFLKKNYPQQ